MLAALRDATRGRAVSGFAFALFEMLRRVGNRTSGRHHNTSSLPGSHRGNSSNINSNNSNSNSSLSRRGTLHVWQQGAVLEFVRSLCDQKFTWFQDFLGRSHAVGPTDIVNVGEELVEAFGNLVQSECINCEAPPPMLERLLTCMSQLVRGGHVFNQACYAVCAACTAGARTNTATLCLLPPTVPDASC